MTTGPTSLPPALVISLDFELHWGVRDKHPVGDAYTRNLVGARRVIPRLLELFEEFRIAATWATVGFLFARSREELERFSPRAKPAYRDSSLSPYTERVGETETDDPLHYASSLIERIRETPRQEIASHTYSHYYCGEAGQTAETFRADVEAACAIATARGLSVRSIVFPRNQHVAAYDAILLENGIRAYRGNPRSRLWRFDNAEQSAASWKRGGRVLDTYLGAAANGPVRWEDVLQPNGLSDVRASCFLRPYSHRLRHLERLRLARIRRGIRAAARTGRIFHLWWHPHNFGACQDENLAFLRGVLTEFARCRDELGMCSLSMAEVDDRLRGDIQLPRASGPSQLADPRSLGPVMS